MAHQIHCLRVSTTLYDGIVDSALSPNIAETLQGGDGSLYNTFAATLGAAPALRFTSVKVAQNRALSGAAGAAIGTAVEAFLVEEEAFGTRKSTGQKLALSNGVIVPRTISADQGGVARLAQEIVLGGAAAGGAPYSFTADQTVPTAATVDELFTLGPITVDGTSIGGVQSLSFDFGVGLSAVQSDGQTYPRLVAVNAVAPRLTFDTNNIGLLLSSDPSLGGLGSLELNAGDAEPVAVAAYLAELTEGGVIGSTGEKITCSYGLLVPRSLTVSAAGDAVLSYEVVLGGHTGAPFSLASSQDLPDAATGEALYGVGDVSVDGGDLGRIQDLTIDFGHAVAIEAEGGSLYPAQVVRRATAPTMTLTTLNAETLASGVAGLAGAERTVVATFKKRSSTGFAGSGDVTITANQARVMVDELGGSHGDDATSRVTVTTTYDGTNAPLTAA